MTREELSKLYWLNREIQLEQLRLEELRSAAESVTSPISGLPHVKGELRRAEDIRILLAEQVELVALKVKQSVIEYNRLLRFIGDVDDPLVREILRRRFVDGQTWRDVAQSLGGGNSEEGVRKLCYRFLKGSQ